MPRKILSLDPVHLSHPANNLKLTLVVKLHVTISDNFADKSDDYIHDALTSGTLWPNRGAFFSMDFHLLLDQVAESLAPKQKMHVAESLGYRLRDADLWSRLCLLPVLEFPRHGDEVNNTTPDLSLCIRHKMPIQSSVLQPISRDRGSSEIKPPDSVPCASIERLQIYLNIETNSQKQNANLSKKSRKRRGSFGEMLLEQALNSSDTRHLQSFEKVVCTLSGNLSKSISQCFPSPKLNPIAHRSNPVDQLSESVRFHGDWDHSKEILLSPLSSFLVHVADQSEDDMLLTSSPVDMSKHQADELGMDTLLWPNLPVPPEDLVQHSKDFTLSQMTDQTPSPTTQTSYSSISGHSFTSFPQPPEQSSLKPSNTGLTFTSQPTNEVSKVNKIVEAALIVLIAGSNSRCRPRALKSIRVKQPLPKASLIELAPTLFSPDFREAIASNSGFLPTISCAISLSWPRNVQSPTLRRKILELSQGHFGENHVAGNSVQESHNLEGLAKAVQSRLWSMMRRKLFDRSAIHSLFKGSDMRSPENVNGDIREDEELLVVSEMDNPGVTEMDSHMIKEEEDNDKMSDFNDLLGGEDSDDEEDLLGFFDEVERERIKTEQETEEMLFGDAWGYDSDADMLLDAGVKDDSMLIND